MSFFIHVDEEQNKAHISITLVVFSVRRSGWLNELDPTRLCKLPKSVHSTRNRK
jgi:hypothetical protein